MTRHNKSWFLAACLAAAWLHLSPPAHAQPVDQQLPLDTPVQIERAFRTGLRLIAEGKPREAVRIFRHILARNPGLPRVRLELARAYFVARSWAESRAEFTAVLSSDVPEGVKKTILKFLNAIDARRGFDWNLSVAFSSSANSSRKYKTDTVHLNFFGSVLPFTVERQEAEPWGMTMAASGELRTELGKGPTGALVGFVQGSANAFEARGMGSDDHALGLTTGFRFAFPRSVTLLAVRGSIREFAHKRYENRHGLTGSYEWRSLGGGSYFVSLAGDRINNRQSDFRDGTELSARAGLMQSFSGTSSLGMAFQVANLDAEAGFESYTRRGVEFMGRADLGYGFGANAKLAYSRTVYHETAPFFLNQRGDNLIAGNLEIAKNDIFLMKAFKPYISISPSRNISNIGIYTYNEFRFIFGLKNAF